MPSSQPLDTIAAEVRAEREVLRSRFIATLHPAEDAATARTVIDRVRREFPAARHHCTAMVLGTDGAYRRSSDDGEPSGTAGAPMLAVVVGAALTDVVVVVTRFFGGTLLGAGGLVRAYGGVVSDAVATASRVVRRPVTRVRLEVAMTDAGRIEHLLHTALEDLHLDVGPGSYTAAAASFEVVVDDAIGIAGLRSRLAGQDAEVTLTEVGAGVRAVPSGGGAPDRRQRPSHDG